MEQIPTGDYESRRAKHIEAGDRVFIDGSWQEIEAAGEWPGSGSVEVTTEPHSEGHVFEPNQLVPVAVGEVGSRPKGEAFTLRIEIGNAAMSDAGDVADALARVASMVGETGSWEGSISDYNGNTVGSYLLGDDVKPSAAAVILNEQVIELPADVVALVAATFSRDADTIEAVDATWAKLREIFPASLAPEPDDDGMTRIEEAV